MKRFRIICTVILIMFPLFGFAQDILKDFEKILIRNVTVIDQARNSERNLDIPKSVNCKLSVQRLL